MPNTDDKHQAHDRPAQPPPQQEQPQHRQRRQAPSAEAKAAADKREAEQQQARAAASIGGQVILDPESEAAKAARGGVYRDQVRNTQHRDEDLVRQGLDPVDTTGGYRDHRAEHAPKGEPTPTRVKGS
jgi:hypothetical protein